MSMFRADVESIAAFVESDTIAMTYQSLGQYRRDLLKLIRVALAQPETAEPVAWAVVCAGNAVSTCLTETAANLIAENLREKNRGRDFDWQTTPLYAHPPRHVQPPTEAPSP